MKFKWNGEIVVGVLVAAAVLVLAFLVRLFI